MDGSELKPCPFCGGEAEHSDTRITGFWHGFARCKNNCTGFMLIDNWQSRTSPSDEPKSVSLNDYERNFIYNYFKGVNFPNHQEQMLIEALVSKCANKPVDEPNGPKRPSKIIVNCPKCYKNPCECKTVDEAKKSCTCMTDPNSCEYHDMDLSSKPYHTTSEVAWPEKMKAFNPTDEQVGRGAHYDLAKIKGWNACHSAFMSIIDKMPSSKPHACKCRNDEGGGITVKRLDEGLFECPRCGGIIVFKDCGHETLDEKERAEIRDCISRCVEKSWRLSI